MISDASGRVFTKIEPAFPHKITVYGEVTEEDLEEILGLVYNYEIREKGIISVFFIMEASMIKNTEIMPFSLIS